MSEPPRVATGVLTALLLLAMNTAASSAEQSREPSPIPGEIVLPALDWQPPQPPQRVQLASSLLYLIEAPRLPLVKVIAVAQLKPLQGGPAHEGTAFLTAALMRRAGAGDRSSSAFDDRVAELAIELETHATRDRFIAVLDTPSWNLDAALELFFDMLEHPRFEPRWVRASRENVAAQLDLGPTSADGEAELRWLERIYGSAHFAAQRLTGATVRALERSDLVNFHRQALDPATMFFTVTGDFTRASIVERFEQHLVGPSSAQSSGVSSSEERAMAPTSGTLECDRSAPATPPGIHWAPIGAPPGEPATVSNAVAVVAGTVTPTLPAWSTDDRVGLEVLVEIAGGRGAISRIQGRLRTAEGLTYATDFQLGEGPCGNGELRLSFSTSPAHVGTAILAVRQELEILRRQPVSNTELETVRTTLLARKRIGWDTAEEVAGYAAEDAVVGRPSSHWSRYSERLRSTTPQQLRRLARRYLLPDSLVVEVVGPVTDEVVQQVDTGPDGVFLGGLLLSLGGGTSPPDELTPADQSRFSSDGADTE